MRPVFGAREPLGISMKMACNRAINGCGPFFSLTRNYGKISGRDKLAGDGAPIFKSGEIFSVSMGQNFLSARLRALRSLRTSAARIAGIARVAWITARIAAGTSRRTAAHIIHICVICNLSAIFQSVLFPYLVRE